MFNTLSKMMSGMFDDVHAPAEVMHVEPYGDTMTQFATENPVEWTNGFGTLNDFEVPASSSMDCMSTSDPFSTW